MEDYKQKYEEALERAKVINPGTADYEVAVKIFPELKESEDERIRRELISFFTIENWHGAAPFSVETAKERVAWLEKQGEQKLQGKPALEVWKDMRLEVYQQASGNRHEPNYSDDSTKMFSLTDIDEIFEKVAEKQGEQKVVKFMTKSYITPNPEFFQWIYNRLVYQHHENPNMDYMLSLKERIEDMQEIVNVKTSDVLVKQKPAWSEDDEQEVAVLKAYIHSKDWSERHVDRALGIVDELVNKVKSVRPQPKQQWSEEDEMMLNHTISTVKLHLNDVGSDKKEILLVKEEIDWLKSLKERMNLV